MPLATQTIIGYYTGEHEGIAPNCHRHPSPKKERHKSVRQECDKKNPHSHNGNLEVMAKLNHHLQRCLIVCNFQTK
jgi:hypothetical protein